MFPKISDSKLNQYKNAASNLEKLLDSWISLNKERFSESYVTWKTLLYAFFSGYIIFDYTVKKNSECTKTNYKYERKCTSSSQYTKILNFFLLSLEISRRLILWGFAV